MLSSWSNSEAPEAPRDILPAITSVISALPTPTLRNLSIDVNRHGIPSAYFNDALPSVILRCGPSFTRSFSSIPLSNAAINHLIHLPHFRIWHTEHPPPNYSASSLPLVLPPLIRFTLWEGAAPGWLSLFKRLGDFVPSTQGATPLFGVMGPLEYLHIGSFRIRTFRNLNHLIAGAHYDDQCIFKLNDENVTELAMALNWSIFSSDTRATKIPAPPPSLASFRFPFIVPTCDYWIYI